MAPLCAAAAACVSSSICFPRNWLPASRRSLGQCQPLSTPKSIRPALPLPLPCLCPTPPLPLPYPCLDPGRAFVPGPCC